MISVPEKYTKSFVYVDCGARGELAHPFISRFPGSQYLGFEADTDECARLQVRGNNGYTYFPVAVGSANETRSFYITRNPACSSLLVPNQGFFSQFLDSAGDTEVQTVTTLSTVPLDDYLPKVGIDSVDFIELDTQGSELEILQGAAHFLKNTVLGLKIETEFSPIYQNQPLFSEVDAFVRSCGFVFFDLSRHRFRRQSYPRNLPTRGQVLFGHAIYMKDYRLLPDVARRESAIKLSMIADFYSFWDYSYEIISNLLALPTTNIYVKEGELEFLSNILKDYENISAKKTRMKKIIQVADLFYARKLLERIVRICGKISSAYLTETATVQRTWAD